MFFAIPGEKGNKLRLGAGLPIKVKRGNQK